MRILDNEHLARIVELPNTEDQSNMERLTNSDKEVVLVSRTAVKKVDNTILILPPWGSFTPPMPSPMFKPLSLAGFLGDIPDD